MERRYRIAMDIGGTFTDFVRYDQVTGQYRTEKVSTTPGNLSRGVLEGLHRLAESFAAIDFCVHGTTAGLNAVLERKGAKVALLTTEGFRDVYEIARGNRPEMYNVMYRKPEPLLRRRDVFEVAERVRFDGSVLRPFDPATLAPAVDALRQGGYQSVTVCLLHAYINPDHELAVRQVLQRELPGISVSLSHEVAREWREYERTSTTVLNAYVAPIVEHYLSHLEREVQERGMEEQLFIMRSNGGVMTAEVAKAHPIQTLLSGPVGGAVGGAALAESIGRRNLIGIDMGGTSFDVSLVIDGKVDVTNETNLEGFPILTPMVNIHTIGAGGGSIAWIEGGGLRVGPQSAGAQPGPACYGRGGIRPTVTDANVALGRIDPDHFLGGNMKLDKEAAVRAVTAIAGELGLTFEQAAEGICDVANAKMADAIRTLTVRKGIDPREFTLVAFGGAGPMHAVFIAQQLEIKEILVPSFPGAFSAWGMLQSDIRHDEVRTYVRPVSGIDTADMAGVYRVVEAEVTAVLRRQKIGDDRTELHRTVDMRYVGQEYTVNVELPDGALTPALLADLTARFHDQHQAIYGHCDRQGAVETVNLRLVGIGRLSTGMQAQLGQPATAPAVPRATQVIIFNGRSIETPLYERDGLRTGHLFDGPAIIEEFTATTIVPPGYRIAVDQFQSLLITAVEGGAE